MENSKAKLKGRLYRIQQNKSKICFIKFIEINMSVFNEPPEVFYFLSKKKMKPVAKTDYKYMKGQVKKTVTS